MNDKGFRHVYGPVPSRRLGRSLGIDLVPLKVCNYDCIYCQLGRTTQKTLERKPYVAIETILAELKQKLASSDVPDYISLAGSGEPTLNSEIGGLIQKIKQMTHIPVAVLTNGSLLWMPEVREALLTADLVLPSLDAGDEELFRYVNRPHPAISFEQMVEGITEFTRIFQGEVWLEIMLLAGVTGMPAEIKKIAALAGRIRPARIQLNTVCRPPAEEFAFALSATQIRVMKKYFPAPVDIISHRRRDRSLASASFHVSSQDVLALLSRRPCTSSDIASGLNMPLNEVLKQLDVLATAGKLSTSVTSGKRFYTIIQPPEESK
ncbi:MAG TPA: radical SAM protein [bacterium]|nr:radical SAM protein [bacterium]HOL96832.1 radical SAM protein [bacterium]HPP01659.1 radical SAM protein [bacterium]HXK93045.1 radical SAM protein [bacterium]